MRLLTSPLTLHPQGNYVLDRDELVEAQKPEYDVVLCLSLTKWVHLNWGDEGLKRMFRRIYLHLRPGGILVLAESWTPSEVAEPRAPTPFPLLSTAFSGDLEGGRGEGRPGAWD